jgi:Alpha/beta hydrolase family
MYTARSEDGTSIAFDRVGDGPPVVIVAGALSTRAANSQLAGLLADSFTVFNYDRRGRADSADTPPYAPEREVEDLRAIVDEAGGSAFVFGSSSGSNLALLAAAAGLDIHKLALWEPIFVVEGSRPPLPPDYVEHLNQLVAEGDRGEAVEYFLTTGALLPAEFVAPMREAPFWPGMEAVAHTIAYDGSIVTAAMPDGAGGEEWAAVRTPALVLDGGMAPWLTDAAEAIAAALPNGRRRTLEGQTHDFSAQAMAPALAQFFE